MTLIIFSSIGCFLPKTMRQMQVGLFVSTPFPTGKLFVRIFAFSFLVTEDYYFRHHSLECFSSMSSKLSGLSTIS
jgi:hypothetical protein